jgi:hypothetical protein
MKKPFTCWRRKAWISGVFASVFGLMFAALWLPLQQPPLADRLLDIQLPKMRNIPPNGALTLDVAVPERE